MSDFTHSAFMGPLSDHLYPDCPPLQRSEATTGVRYPGMRIGEQCLGTVDPLGTDICGLCVHRWKRKHAESLRTVMDQA
jgi:hypothetical protein